MPHRLRRRSWPWQVAAIALAVLSLAVGLCFFDDDGSGTDQHAVAWDSCSGLLVALLTVPPLLGLVGLDRVRLDSFHPVWAVSLRRIDPPPKSLPLS